MEGLRRAERRRKLWRREGWEEKNIENGGRIVGVKKEGLEDWKRGRGESGGGERARGREIERGERRRKEEGRGVRGEVDGGKEGEERERESARERERKGREIMRRQKDR